MVFLLPIEYHNDFLVDRVAPACRPFLPKDVPIAATPKPKTKPKAKPTKAVADAPGASAAKKARAAKDA